MPNKPIKQIKAGQIICSIWQNEPMQGREYLLQSISFQRRYKVGHEWKSSSNFYANDLQKLILLAQKAQEFLFMELNQQEKSNIRDDSNPISTYQSDKISELKVMLSKGLITKEGYGLAIAQLTNDNR